MKCDEKITKILEGIDDLLNEADKLTFMLEMLDGYLESYEDVCNDHSNLSDYCRNLLKNHKSIKNKIENIHNVLVEN